MSIKLKLGDIIVFKAEEDDWLSKAIAWFSGGDTSHAAMLYQEDTIIELLADGVCVHQAKLWKGTAAYVMRHCDEPDAKPLLAAAAAYKKAGIRYDFSGLILLAGLFIYRKIKPNQALMIAGSKLLMLAIFKIDQLIHKISKNDTPTMLCSQFVYQIYYNCGKEYRIAVDWQYNRLESEADTCLLQGSDPEICLFDLLSEDQGVEEMNKMPTDMLATPMAMQEDKDDLVAKEFYMALTSESSNLERDQLMLGIQKRGMLDQSLKLSEQFISKIKKLLQVLKLDIPMDALFVTPGDMVYHAKNLNLVTLVNIERNL